MTDLHWLTLTEASALIRDRKLSPVEYTEALYARADRLDPLLNTYILQTRESALAEARHVEQEIASGKYRGPLHGVPYGLKDIIDYAGVPTTAHSRVLQDNVAQRDATVTARFKDAGAVMLGKLATHEFAIGGPSFDLPWPPARNPWNRKHFTGGSSSGSGAAVAAGLMALALGTDTGGSVRNPASLCGLVGMKPTYGRVSKAGVVPLAFSLDTVGPLTRTVEDSAIALNVMAGHDPADTSSIRAAAPDFTSALRAGAKGLRVGVIRHFYTRDMEADPEMAAAIDDAAGVLDALGAEVREITLAPLEVYSACYRTIMLSEAYSIHERWLQERPEAYGELARERIIPGALVRAVDYVHATRLRTRLMREFEEAMEGLDVAITASSMDPAGEIEDREVMEATYGRQARNAFNITGTPAMSVPIGFSRNGLPLSMQIVGRAYDEVTVYRAGFAYEEASDWKQRHPPIDEQGV